MHVLNGSKLCINIMLIALLVHKIVLIGTWMLKLAALILYTNISNQTLVKKKPTFSLEGWVHSFFRNKIYANSKYPV